MGRIRSISPDVCTSETMASCSASQERLFFRMLTQCDDEGRCSASPRWLKAIAFPLNDDVTPATIEEDLRALDQIRLIVLYEVDGKAFLQVRSWDEFQHPKKPQESKIPPPPEGASRPRRKRPDPPDPDPNPPTGGEPVPPEFPTSSPPVPHQFGTGSEGRGVEWSGVEGSGEERKATTPPVPPAGVPGVPPAPQQPSPSPAAPEPPPKPEPPAKPKARRSRAEIIGAFPDHVRHVVNSLVLPNPDVGWPGWRKADPDGRPIRALPQEMAENVQRILREHPEVTQDLLVEAGRAYCAQDKFRYKAPQHFFGPGGPSERPIWPAYVREILTRRQRDGRTA